MITKKTIKLLLQAVFGLVLSSYSVLALYHPRVLQDGGESKASDPISGEWDVSFRVDASRTPASFKLKLEGDKVSGTAYSDHTGPGMVRDGNFSNNKLSFILDFANHESIAITGAFKDGKLTGEFRTEGFVSDWEAKKKTSEKKAEANGSATANGDPISGRWDANFEVGEHKAPVILNLKLDGAKVTGTSESSIAGSGTLSGGSWTPNTVSFTMPGPHGPVLVNGVLKDGKLVGTFSMGEMKGTWDAKR